MLQFDHVSKSYPGGFVALERINFRITKGEMVFLTGHSGAGKSTILKLISMIERPSTGRVMINNIDLSRLKRSQVPYVRRDVGIIYQNHRLLMHHTVFDNVALPLVIEGFTGKEMVKRVHAALDKVGLLDKQHCLPQTLSGGEQQRVGIARAVVNKPGTWIRNYHAILCGCSRLLIRLAYRYWWPPTIWG
jgi:cell division transport system ATP-binding protein